MATSQQSLFLRMGQIIASFHISGTSPLHIEALNIKLNGLHKLSHKLLKNILGSLSGPAAQPFLTLRSAFSTAQAENVTYEIEFDLDLSLKLGRKPLSLVKLLAK